MICYVYNIETCTFDYYLFDLKNQIKFEFGESGFIMDNNNYYEYCIVAVNGKRESRKQEAYSFLYQYSIDDEFRKCGQCKLIKGGIIRMINDVTSNCIITLHNSGAIIVTNGLNLTKLSKMENPNGTFFMDINYITTATICQFFIKK